MSRYQVVAIAITVALCALDGFDVMAASFAAPGIVKQWSLSKATLGMVFSAGLAGMAIGSLGIAPFADRIGRRAMILITLAILAVGMLLTALAQSVQMLLGWRILTGLGIGAMISVIYPLAAEYANARRHDVAVGVAAIGYPIGGVVGGLVVALLLPHYGWRSIFLLGSGAAALLWPVVYFCLPESVHFLLSRRPSNALTKINLFLARCKALQISHLPPADPAVVPPRYRDLLGQGMIDRTLLLTAINALFVVSVYYMLSWTPQIVAQFGFSAAQAARASVAFNLGGIVGGAAIGWAARWAPLKRLMLIVFSGAAVMTMIFGYLPAHLTLLYVNAFVCGIFLMGGMIGLYAITARTFPASSRAAGTGLVVGVGRASSAIGPAIAGFMLAAHFTRWEVATVMAIPAATSALVLAGFTVRAVSTEGGARH